MTRRSPILAVALVAAASSGCVVAAAGAGAGGGIYLTSRGVEPEESGSTRVEVTARTSVVTWDKDYARTVIEKIVELAPPGSAAAPPPR